MKFDQLSHGKACTTAAVPHEGPAGASGPQGLPLRRGQQGGCWWASKDQAQEAVTYIHPLESHVTRNIVLLSPVKESSHWPHTHTVTLEDIEFVWIINMTTLSTPNTAFIPDLTKVLIFLVIKINFRSYLKKKRY